MLTPRVFEVTSPTTEPAPRRAAKRPRVLRPAVYVAYRRRSSTGAIGVATGLAERRSR